MRDPFFYLITTSVVLLGLVSFVLPLENRIEFSAAVNVSSDQLSLQNSAYQKTFIESANTQKGSSELNLIQNSTLLGFAPPITVTPRVLGDMLGGISIETSKDIIEYEVKTGDTISSLAEQFNISANTIFWANSMTKNSTIKVGQTLVILPVTGALHHIKSGDTVSAIALKYKAKTEDIVAFNNLSSENDIYVGDMLTIPAGIMPQVVSNSSYVQVPIASSYFICPIAAPCRVTQKLHFYNAIDFSHGKCGDSIYAAAGGIVQRVKYGWNGGAGNTITILHPNGVVTSYGHIQAALIGPGDQVNQGQIIALMGGQPGTSGAGQSTGCHVHFSVSGGINPFGK